MKIRFTQTAIAEVDEIFSFIARDNPVAAAAVIRQIDRTIGRLATFPEMGHQKFKAGVRMLQVRRFRQYLIFIGSKMMKS